MKRTKIVCTIGPASEKGVVIEKMIKAGMNVARLNFSHGTYKNHAMLIKNIRDVSKKSKIPVAIMQDLQGPRIRIGQVHKMGVPVTEGEKVVLVPDNITNCPSKEGQLIPIQYHDLYRQVKKNDRILVSDGLIELKVMKTKKPFIFCKIIKPGIIYSHKGINVPSVKIKVDVITDKDKEDIKFGIKKDVDWIALSFVKDASDIIRLRGIINRLEGKKKTHTKIIAKIERGEAVKNFGEILEVVDGVMIARGDLGIELPPEEIPLIQKKIIDKCLVAAKPVIVATQMLDSMITNPRPTRAEVSDVANAVIDHTDAVMLSGETATGKYPIESVDMMKKIIEETEKSPLDDMGERKIKIKDKSVSDSIADAANVLARELKVRAIIAASASGYTARLISRHRPEHLITVVTNDEKVRRQLVLNWGLYPYTLPTCKSLDELVNKSVTLFKKEKILKVGDHAIIIASHPLNKNGKTNLVKALKV